jgi:hypothetical protein
VVATAWEFWRISRADNGQLEWLGATRRSPRNDSERGVVWTLVAARLAFLPNWFVSEDHERLAEDAVWVHEWIDVSEARPLALELASPAPDDVARLASSAAPARYGELQRFDIESVLGTRTANAIAARRL